MAHEKEMLEGTKILWSEYLDYYYLMCKKQAMGEKSFYKELQNDPRSTDEYIFQNLIYWDRLPEFEEMEPAIYIDPAIKAGKKNDYSAISIIGQHRKTKQMHVIDGNVYKLLLDDLFQIAVEKLKLYPVGKLGFEVNQAQSYMKQSLKKSYGKRRYIHP